MCVNYVGILVGILLRFGLPDSEDAQFIFSRRFSNETCSKDHELQIGETIRLSSHGADSGNGDSFLCSITGKAFRDQEGNYIRQTVSFQL